MEIVIKVSQAKIKQVQQMDDGITEAQAVEKIQRVLQNFATTDDMMDDIFDGIGDD